MKEALLQYAWLHKLYYTGKLTSTLGRNIEVIDPGQLNSDSGPDFFNAKIKIDDTLWAGNVEVHINASDWHKHHHDSDKAYDNIILHVVCNHDTEIHRTNGEAIDQLVLPCLDGLEAKYEALMAQQQFVYCASHLNTIPRIVLSSWKSALVAEKLQNKVNDIESLLQETQNNWEEAFYITLARNFGTGINAVPFELLAKSLPQIYLAKHKDHLFQLETMLFGQSGLLETAPEDEYVVSLRREYAFLQTKFRLQPIDHSLWKLLRLRPQNFPHIRIAQLAYLVHRSSRLFSEVLQCQTISDTEELFGRCQTSAYWKEHYTFGKTSLPKDKSLGASTIRGIMINTVVPFLFAYGKTHDDFSMQDRALYFLEQIVPEQNSIVENWKSHGITAMSAYDTQALIFLKKHYCDHKRCLQCRIGHHVLSHKI